MLFVRAYRGVEGGIVVTHDVPRVAERVGVVAHGAVHVHVGQDLRVDGGGRSDEGVGG